MISKYVLSFAHRLHSQVGQASLLFVVIALFFGFIIAQEVPPFWGLDESAHFSRVYQISEGQLLPQKVPDGNYGGLVPASVAQLDKAVHQDVVTLAPGPVIERHDLRHQAAQKAVGGQPLGQHLKVIYHFPGSAAYTPLAYVAPATGTLLCRAVNCSLDSAVFIARIFSLIAYTAVVAFAIWLLRAKKIKWLIFVIGLLPMALFQAASVSADGPALSLSLLLFAIVIKALSDKKLPPYLIGVLAATAICLPLIKINYGLLDVSLIPIALAISSKKDRKRAFLYTAAFLGFIAILTLCWLYLARGPGKMIATLHAPDSVTHAVVSAKQQSRLIVYEPLEFLQAMRRTILYNEDYLIKTTTGQFALNAIAMPPTAAIYGCLIIVCAAFYARNELLRYKKVAVGLGLLSILTALSIFGTLYVTFTPVGGKTIDGIQGRYFIPLIPFFIIGIAALVPIKLSMSSRTATILFSLSSCILLLSGVIYYGLATY